MTNGNELTATVNPDGDSMQVAFSDGTSHTVRKLLADGSKNTKLAKNQTAEYLPYGLSLAPEKTAGIGNVCPFAGACVDTCLDDTGHASVFPLIRLARRARTACYYLQRSWFIDRLMRDLAAAAKRARKQCKQLVTRLNVFSDIRWEAIAPDIFSAFSDSIFYDYTKDITRAGHVASNYWVTLSRDESNWSACQKQLAAGNNVAVVFACGFRAGKQQYKRQLPASYQGYPVHSGENSDLRFNDPTGHIIGLTLKAPSHAKYEAAVRSGFAVSEF